MARRRTPRGRTAHQTLPWLEARLAPVDHDEWQGVHRQALQLGRVLRGERQLLEENESAKEAQMAAVGNDIGNGKAARALSTRELVVEITGTVALLARKEVELARTEMKADLRSQIAMVTSLGAAALLALLGLDLLLVAGVLALAPWVAPWLSALVGGAALLLVGATIGSIGWARRVGSPLALTRKTIKEDVRWAKERLS